VAGLAAAAMTGTAVRVRSTRVPGGAG
jgi:hypothetical protein